MGKKKTKGPKIKSIGAKSKKLQKKLAKAQVETENQPRSFVFRRGKVGATIIALTRDIRRVMEPNTAVALQESKKNQMKDFLSVAPQLGVTHFLVFTQTVVGTNLRVVRIPRGPTLTFRVVSYSLAKDVVSMQKRPHSPGVEFKHAPLVVLNNFNSNEDHIKLMATMFTNMYPSIDVKSIKLNDCRRIVLLNYDAATQTIEWRHYVITCSPVGLTKSVKRIIKGKIADLGKFKDVSDYVENPGAISDSEIEDTPDNKVNLPQNFTGRGNRRSQKSAIRLKEMGPRMKLQLLKVEEEFCGGKVLYHSFLHKSEEEARELEKKKKKEEAEKKQRREEQEANVKRKTEEREKKEAERLERRRKRQEDLKAAAEGDENTETEVDDEDAEHEVGETSEPDEGVDVKLEEDGNDDEYDQQDVKTGKKQVQFEDEEDPVDELPKPTKPKSTPAPKRHQKIGAINSATNKRKPNQKLEKPGKKRQRT